MAKIRQFVGFVLGKEHYGVDIMGVEEIIRPLPVTPLPRAPKFVEGIINIRGRVVPVIDLRKRLNIPLPENTDDVRIIVMSMNNKRLGFIVDKVEEVVRLDEEQIQPAGGMQLHAREYIESIAHTNKGVIILLDVVKMFSQDEQSQIAQIR